MTNAPLAATNVWSIADLRDYALPAPVSLFPLSGGAWWCLAVGGLVVVCAAVLVVMRWRGNAYRRAALSLLAELEVDMCGGQSALSRSLPYQVSSILKRTALVAWPRASVAALHGQAWVDFLRKSGASACLPQQVGEMLVDGDVEATADAQTVAQLLVFARDWVRLHQSPPDLNAATGEDGA
jgi:hypothetical protein